MNNDPNIDSKQCPESKLGQTHPWPRLRTRPAVSWNTRRRVVAFPRSYRSLCQAVSWPCRRHVAASTRALAHCVAALCRDTRPCHRPLPVMIQNLYRDLSLYLARIESCVTPVVASVAAPGAVSWRIAEQYRSPGALYHDPKSPPSSTIQFSFFVSRPKGRPAHDTNFVSQHPHLARLRARCASCHRPPQSCRARSRSYRGRAWPCFAPLMVSPGLPACSACCVPT